MPAANSRADPFFSHRRFLIETHYRLTIDDDEYMAHTYQLGSGDTRHKFPAGAFASSGSFILTVESICAIDRWERAFHRLKYIYVNEIDETLNGLQQKVRAYRDESDKPAVFPPEENN